MKRLGEFFRTLALLPLVAVLIEQDNTKFWPAHAGLLLIISAVLLGLAFVCQGLDRTDWLADNIGRITVGALACILLIIGLMMSGLIGFWAWWVVGALAALTLLCFIIAGFLIREVMNGAMQNR